MEYEIYMDFRGDVVRQLDRLVDNIFPFYWREVIEDNLRACYPPLKHYRYINLLNPVNQL